MKKRLESGRRWLAEHEIWTAILVPFVVMFPFYGVFRLTKYVLSIPDDDWYLSLIFALLYGSAGGLIFRWIERTEKANNSDPPNRTD